MNKGLIVTGIVFCFFLIGLGVYGAFSSSAKIPLTKDSSMTNKEGSTTSNETNNTNDSSSTASTDNSKTLTCSYSEYQVTYFANCITKVVMTFKNNELYDFNSTMVYQYTDAASYQKMWGSLTERSGSGDTDGLKTSWTLDDSNLRYTILMSANVDDLKNGNWTESSGLKDYSYDSFRQYYIDQEIPCE